MVLGVRVGHTLPSVPVSSLLLLPLSTSRRLPYCFLHSAASPAPKACDLNGETREFLGWFRQKAGVDISTVLSIGSSIYGRSLFATKKIEAGDCILKVPYDAQLTAQNIPVEIDAVLSNEIDNTSRVALVVLAEKKLALNSEWATYITRLPHVHEMHNTVFWSKDELEMIQQSPVYQETINQQAFIVKEFSALRPVLERFSQVFGQVHLKEFMHAYSLGMVQVDIRSYITGVGNVGWSIFDFINDDGTSDSIVLCDVDKKISEVIADRNYNVGEEVIISYGKHSNATLMLDFGYTLPHNIHDQVQLSMNIPAHDPLQKMKLEILQKHLLPPTTEAKKFSCSGCLFIVKEVKSPRGKGKGIPQALRAFARILSATSVQELDSLVVEAAQADSRLARRPLDNTKREIQAHSILHSQFIQMIQHHEAALKELDSLPAADIDVRPHRIKMARDLLKGELRVMKSACTWLMNYCSTSSA